jgi:hypothetical protein
MSSFSGLLLCSEASNFSDGQRSTETRANASGEAETETMTESNLG